MRQHERIRRGEGQRDGLPDLPRRELAHDEAAGGAAHQQRPGMRALPAGVGVRIRAES
jgi:hypothetical protein